MSTSKDLYIYNTLTSKKEKFIPINFPFVGLYVCGPTVYNKVHLGNLRSFFTFDIVYRYLIHLGYKVRYVRNITDVGHLTDDGDDGDDKMERQARIEKIEPMEVAQRYINDFYDVRALFNLINPSIEPIATGHIPEQIQMVQKIIDKGYAYEVNGSVYFDVKKYAEKHHYGKLSGRKLDDLLEQTREELSGGDEKRFFADFGLWKKASPKALMKWDSPWGIGVPGWHLECSVMSSKYLGNSFDIHGGGMDLKFPHHECEIAQSVIANNTTSPVNYWMHGNMLTVNGTKMGKSLNNSFLPMELITGNHPLLEQGYSPMTVRLFFLQTNYKSTIDFSNTALQASEKGLKRLMSTLKTLDNIEPSTTSSVVVTDLFEKVTSAMKDDFNTPLALAHLFDGVKLINTIYDGKEQITSADLEQLKNFYTTFIFDIFGLKEEENNTHDKLLEEVMEVVLNTRGKLKDNKDWDTSDFIRNELNKLGITLKDSADNSEWSLDT